MRNIPKLSRVLVAGILAILAMYAVSGAAFAAYSYDTYDVSETTLFPDGATRTKLYHLAIPKGLKTVKGILVVSNATNSDLRYNYTIGPFYEQFLQIYDFAWIGMAAQPNGVEPPHTESQMMFQNALAHLASSSGHSELLDAPYVVTGVSAGGGFSSRLATTYPEKVIASFIVAARLNLDADKVPLVTPAMLNTPILDLGGDGGSGSPQRLLDWRPAPYNALWSNLSLQGTGDEYIHQDLIGMPFFERALRLRYPDGGDPSQGPLKLKTLAPSSGWIADNTTWKSGLTYIDSAASFTGDISKTSWLMDKDLAYIYRAYATYDLTPGYNPHDMSKAIREIRLTSPETDQWFCDAQDPGNVTIQVDASIFARNFPGWTKLEFYDGSTKLGEATPPGTSKSFTANLREPGYHILSVLGCDANGKAVRTSNPTMVIIKGKYQYPKSNGSSPKLESRFASNPGFESGSLTPGWTATSGTNTVVTGAYSGSYCAKTSGNNSGFQQTLSNLSPNTTYYCQAWAKSGDGSTQAAIGVSNYGGSQISRYATSTGWTRLNFSFTTDADNTTANIWAWIPVGSGDAYFDHFTVSTQPMSNFVNGARFEQYVLTDTWPTTIGTNTIARDDGNAHTGQCSAKSSGTGSRFQQTITGLSPNTTYHGQAWVKSNNATASIGVSSYGGSQVQVDNTNTRWTLKTFTFTTGSTNTTANIWGGITSGTGDGYFDDFSVY